MNSADSGERHPDRSTRSVARVVLTVYGISLALIALWPVPVDSGASGFLRGVTRVLPTLTYARIEFTANILLFVPLGVLLMLILRRRYLILPIAIVTTVAIECSQGLLLDKRTPSLLDIIANTAGACVGMLIVAAVESWRGRPGRERMPVARRREMPSTARGDEAWAQLGIVPPAQPARPGAQPIPPAVQPIPPAAQPIPPKPPLPSWIPPMPPPPGEAAERSRV